MDYLKLISQIVFAVLFGLIGGFFLMLLLGLASFGLIAMIGDTYLDILYFLLVIWITSASLHGQISKNKIGF